MKADLHCHTNYSDGLLSVEEVIKIAKDQGLNYFSITDHDTLEGSILAKEITKDKDIEIILGIELSTAYNGENIHLLGYFNSVENIDNLRDFLDNQKMNRYNRTLEIIDKLEQFDIYLSADDFKDFDIITRGNIADVIINKGYAFTKKEIFNKFIGNNRPAYIPSSKVTPQDGIKILKDSGAVVVLAHPVLYYNTDIVEFINMGIDGIEAIYPANSKEDSNNFIEIADRYNLIITAGSDFHHFDDFSHADIGTCIITNDRLSNFLNKLKG